MSGNAPLAESLLFATSKVTADVWLDSRGALWHPEKRWLAVADLHYGYELTMRQAGGLFPQWGMEDIRARLQSLISHYAPEKLILAGDIMDSHGCAEETLTLLASLKLKVPELICLEGNHERPSLLKRWDFRSWHREEEYLFHHGHVPEKILGCAEAAHQAKIQITGHWHPAVSLDDGAGTRIKLPALVLRKTPRLLQHWVLPAFSPWARGGRMPKEDSQANSRTEMWACHKRRVFLVG